MGMGSTPRGTMLSEINVTPFVDVVLVLLIIFMITAPLAQEGVQVKVPEAGAAPMVRKEGVARISIDERGQVFLGERSMARLDLATSLHVGRNLSELNNITVLARRDPQLQKEKEAYVDAHHALPYGVVVNVMAKLQGAGVTKLGLVTQPPAVEVR